ncbi:MAG TPA: ATP-binding cassette domain-containing protein [Chroococcales cyanobacterium]
MEAIAVSKLRKSYGLLEAVRGIDFSVEAGEIFGFLGPNGAGKTTTINMLCTLLAPSSGAARVAGFDIARERDRVRRSIGIVFQDPALDDRLSALENLRFHGWIYDVPSSQLSGRIDRALELVGLSERRKDLVKTFSGGMKRRLEIARSTLHTPKVLFLDEPTIGLDPQTRARIWGFLHEMRKKEGTTLFLTTHYMEEAENCDRLAIIDRGEIAALDTPARLKAEIGGDTVLIETENNAEALKEIEGSFGLIAKEEENGLNLVVESGSTFLPELFRKLKVPVKHVSICSPSLEDVFLRVTGKAIRQEAAESSFARHRRRRRR